MGSDKQFWVEEGIKIGLTLIEQLGHHPSDAEITAKAQAAIARFDAFLQAHGLTTQLTLPTGGNQ